MIEACGAAAKTWGTSTTGARISNGSRSYHTALEEKLAAFICSVARNLVIEYFRRTARQENLTELAGAERPLHSAPNPLDAVLQKEKAAVVRQVINELPTDRDRQVLFRFYVVEDDKDRICADLGLSSLHFNRVLHRARERYRELYERALSRMERATGD